MSETATAQKLSLARTLLARGGALESSNGSEKIKREKLAEALENTILQEVSMLSDRAPSVTAKVAASEALTHAENALNKTANDGSPSNLSDLEVSALEAIIEVTGRPALRYLDGEVQLPPSALGENNHWQVLVVTARGDINRVSGAVGCIAIRNNLGIAESLGTGWRVGTDLVVTNRHVVEQITKAGSVSKLDNEKKPYIDFAMTNGAQAAQRFQITELVYVADEPLLDVAFLRATSETSALPESLVIDWSKEGPGREITRPNGEKFFQGRQIYVVGHPYRQGHAELVSSVFGVADGLKRCSPGRVTRMDDPNPRLEHDCSTLGGNSGSCVFASDTHEVIGVHVGGVDVNDNTAKGSTNLALALSRLSEHHAGAIMQSEKV